MNWFFYALAGPALWSISNHIDKYLINKFFKGAGVGSLLIFSAGFGFLFLPLILSIEPNVLNIFPLQVFLLFLNSLMYVLATISYLYALRRDETSTVVPMFQMIPVVGYFIAFFFLGEVLNFKQILASLLIISGAVILSLDLAGTKLKFKKVVFLLMVLSSLFYSTGGVFFKMAALNAGFWISTFWSLLSLGVIGLLIYIFIKPYRTQFLLVLRKSRIPVIGVNALNEIIATIASLAVSFATLLAPITLVWVVNGFQPFFVLLYGVILTLFFPHLGSESLVKKHLIQKILAIIIIFIGTYFLNS